MSDSVLRASLIRLASAHPEFRANLLPLLKKAYGSEPDPLEEAEEFANQLEKELNEFWDAESISKHEFDAGIALISRIQHRLSDGLNPMSESEAQRDWERFKKHSGFPRSASLKQAAKRPLKDDSDDWMGAPGSWQDKLKARDQHGKLRQKDKQNKKNEKDDKAGKNASTADSKKAEMDKVDEPPVQASKTAAKQMVWVPKGIKESDGTVVPSGSYAVRKVEKDEAFLFELDGKLPGKVLSREDFDKLEARPAKSAATKTAGSIFFRHPVGIMVRVTQAKQYSMDTMNTQVAGTMIISLSSGAPMAPVQFIAVVRPSSAGWQVVTFRTRQSISGGGSESVVGMCKEFFAAALAQKGDQLLHQEGVLETNEHGAIS